MFGANRDGQGQQYSSPNVTCNERYWNYNVDKHGTIASPCTACTIASTCTISSIVPSCYTAMSAILPHLQSLHYCKHHAVLAVLQTSCMQSDCMQSQQYNYCIADIDNKYCCYNGGY